jgi:uncharacterized protein YndB with AHSA1/START domain
MGRYVAERIIHAPIERVFDYRLDVHNLPEYNPNVHDVEVVSKGPTVEGRTFRFQLRMGPGLWTSVNLTVRNVERPSRLEFCIESLMDAREVCVFESVENGGRGATLIRFEYTVNTRGGFLAPLVDAIFVRPSMRRLVDEELDLIKARLEASRTGRPLLPTSGARAGWPQPASARDVIAPLTDAGCLPRRPRRSCRSSSHWQERP